jgi:hypothetical protein
MDAYSQEQLAKLQGRIDAVEEFVRRTVHPLPADDPKLNLRFITIRRTTDVAAFVALLLSVLAMFFQLQNVFAGPDVKSFLPRQIAIYNSDLLKDQTDFGNKSQVLFAAITSYANRASKEHTGIVLNEFIRVVIGRTKVQHWFYAAGNSVFRGPFQIQSGAMRPIPFGVAGNNGFAHDVLFQPLKSSHCLPADHECAGANTWYSWADFMTDLASSPFITVTLGAELDNQRPLLAGCTVALSADDMNILGSEGHLAAACD